LSNFFEAIIDIDWEYDLLQHISFVDGGTEHQRPQDLFWVGMVDKSNNWAPVGHTNSAYMFSPRAVLYLLHEIARGQPVQLVLDYHIRGKRMDRLRPDHPNARVLSPWRARAGYVPPAPRWHEIVLDNQPNEATVKRLRGYRQALAKLQRHLAPTEGTLQPWEPCLPHGPCGH
jgi:hypothetical protein